LGTGKPGVLGELSAAYQQQLGKAITSQIGYSLIYNTLDQNKDPSRGNYAILSQDFAGLGGDVQLVKTTADARSYYPITNELTAMFRLQGGHVASWGGKELGCSTISSRDRISCAASRRRASVRAICFDERGRGRRHDVLGRHGGTHLPVPADAEGFRPARRPVRRCGFGLGLQGCDQLCE
jgi:hypothetical protein